VGTQAQPAPSAALVASLVVAAFFVAFGGLHYGFYTRKLLEDTPLYERYGDAIVHHHQLPYRDFTVEYPPGALPVFAAPSLVAAAGDFSVYRRVFEALMLACGAAASALVGFVLVRQRAGRSRLVAGTLLAGLAPLALGPVVLSRFDLWPAALTIAALAALVTDRRRLAFGLLAVAIVAKIYPLVLLPIAVAYVWRRAGRREAGVCLAVLAAVAAVWTVPFAIAAPHGVWSSLWGQADRPLQIESLSASLLLAAHQLWALQLTEVPSHGSDNLVGHAPHLLASLQSIGAAALLAGIWVGFARGAADRDRLLRYAAAAVCAFVALNKVLSPQYLIWLIALVPLVAGRRGAVAAGLFVTAAVLTQLWFPRHYIALVYGFDPRASWFVVARDLVLAALLVTLVWPSGRRLRSGIALAAGLGAAAAAAAGMAAASSPVAASPTRSGLLTETGTASSCARPKTAPNATPGSVAYDTAAFPGTGARSRCVVVTLATKPHVQLFTAAYRIGFDETRPRLDYLGDPGTCTNVAGATGPTLRYSFVVPARTRLVVEVESCGGGTSVPPYTLDVGDVRLPVGDGVAVAHHGRVTVGWRAPRATFAVYREQVGIRIRIPGPIRAHGAAYSIVDARPPSAVPYRYWVRAVAAGGRWAWYGPIAQPRR
jgi:glycosyl transferase family 87